MRSSMLTPEQTQLLHEEKEVLKNVLLRIATSDLPKESLDLLQKSIIQLDELFLLVVVGEFNAGKSALINAMLGEKVLTEGVTPTTSRVTMIRWGDTVKETVVDEGYSVVTHPLELLKEVNIVDSPGTNAIIRQHERLTEEFVPRSDLVLFTTSADRPMTESERQFLTRILAWGKKVIFVLNKTDILENPAALEEVKDFISKHAAGVLGDVPQIFPVSARLAQRAVTEMDPAEKERLFAASQIRDLEAYITATLDDSQRLLLKFGNPLGVAVNLVDRAQKSIQVQSDDLKVDSETAKALETTIAAYRHDLEMELPPRLAEVENILHKLEFRGMDFFDRTFRLTNIHHLIRGDAVRAAFEKEVLEDTPAQIDGQVQKLIEWLVEKDLREWQQVMTYLQRRQAAHVNHIVGGGIAPQADRRQEIIDKVGESVKMVVQSYDQVREASALASNVESAVAQTALLEVGAVGLGALVSTAVLSSALDITGMVAAGTLAIVGLFIIPLKRKQARDNFREKIALMRVNLSESLKTSLDAETRHTIGRMEESIAPYMHQHGGGGVGRAAEGSGDAAGEGGVGGEVGRHGSGPCNWRLGMNSRFLLSGFKRGYMMRSILRASQHYSSINLAINLTSMTSTK
jgi:small GTP-binding protein